MNTETQEQPLAVAGQHGETGPKALTLTSDRLAGARACIETLRLMEKSVEAQDNTPAHDATAYCRGRSEAMRMVINAAGPLPSPFLEGFIGCVAEFMHFLFESGQPNLERWTPEATMNEAQLERARLEMEKMYSDIATEARPTPGQQAAAAIATEIQGRLDLAQTNDRAMVALEASWEIASLLDKLIKSASPDATKLWKRGMLIRSRELAYTIMEALGGNEKVPSMRRRVTGVRQAEAR